MRAQDVKKLRFLPSVTQALYLKEKMTTKILIIAIVILLQLGCKEDDSAKPDQQTIFEQTSFTLATEEEFEILDNPRVSFYSSRVQKFKVLAHAYVGRIKLKENDKNQIGFQKIANQLAKAYSLGRSSNSWVAEKIKPNVSYLLAAKHGTITLLFSKTTDEKTFNITLTLSVI